MAEPHPIHVGDAIGVLSTFSPESVQCVVTSPPYWGLRDYGVAGQLGLEPTPEEYVERLVEVFRAVRRVLRDDGTVWLNLGDSYAGAGKHSSEGFNERWHGKHFLTDKQGDTDRERPARPTIKNLRPKNLVGIPWRVAFALQADGWYLRSDIIWHKPNPMPESVRDRPTRSHEYIFLLSKSKKYYYGAEGAKEPAKGGQSKSAASFRRNGSKRAQAIPGQSVGTHRPDRKDVAYDGPTRNRRSVWTVATRPFNGVHFATFPPDLIKPCILAGAPDGGVVLDPFAGAGTTVMVAAQLGRNGVGIELNPEYAVMARERIAANLPELKK